MSENADIATVIICVDNQTDSGKHNEMLVFLCFAQALALVAVSLLNSPCFVINDALVLLTCSRFF
jgi:hypothetical protein